MDHVNQKPIFFLFNGGISCLAPGATHAFSPLPSPAVEDTVRLWRTSSVPSVEAATTKEPPRANVFKLRLVIEFIVPHFPRRHVRGGGGKRASSRVSLPVSRRRCGGRRGGLNDSQHCAVGPGLQSPQRWSFPPPPSHSPSPSTQHAAAPLSPSNQPCSLRRDVPPVSRRPR